MSDPRPVPPDLPALVRAALSTTEDGARGAPTTSDLSIDEELSLHALAWEPVALTTGYAVVAVPAGAWQWGQGEIDVASSAHERAFTQALRRLESDVARTGAHGVVGVSIEREVAPSHIAVAVMGTAVRPRGAGARKGTPFVTDLSARDFARLVASGWEPLGLATGASFVYAPRRSIGTALAQQSQNVELTNFTDALYGARERAVERLQRSAMSYQGAGIVEVKLEEGPLRFASHAVGFAAWGTVVRLAGDQHLPMSPTLVVSLDDETRAFEAQTLE